MTLPLDTVTATTVESLDEDSATYSFQELLDALNDARDIILTVPSEQVKELQDGLQARKSKLNYAARQQGVEPPAERLAFLVYPAKDAAGKAKVYPDALLRRCCMQYDRRTDLCPRQSEST